MMNRSVMQRQMFARGGEALKPIPADNKGLPKLPKEVRNRMGYMQEGGAVPNPPMPEAPVEPPMMPPMMPGEAMAQTLPEDPMRDTLAAVQQNLATLDEADNAEDMINAIRGNELPLEARYAELAEFVGPEDAKQTPESVLALVQPTILMSLDEGIGALAQEEMDVPVEGPMAGGIMSTVAPPADPGPPMPMPMGAPPANFNQGGLVRRGDNQPVQYFQDANPNRVVQPMPMIGGEEVPYTEQPVDPNFISALDAEADLVGNIIFEFEKGKQERTPYTGLGRLSKGRTSVFQVQNVIDDWFKANPEKGMDYLNYYNRFREKPVSLRGFKNRIEDNLRRIDMFGRGGFGALNRDDASTDDPFLFSGGSDVQNQYPKLFNLRRNLENQVRAYQQDLQNELDRDRRIRELSEPAAPVQKFADANPNRVAGMPPSDLMEGFLQRRDVYRSVVGDPLKNIEEQKRLTRAQMLFDIAQTGLAFAAPMQGEPAGLSPAERLAYAARSTQLPQTIGARAAELQKVKTLADEQRRSLDIAALQAAEEEQKALAKAQADKDTAVVKAQLDLEKELRVLGAKNIYELEQQQNLFAQQTQLQNTRLKIEQKLAKLERDRKERQDAITNAQGERRLQLTAEAQAFEEVYKNEKLALEAYAKRLTEFGTTTDARLGVYFSDPELLAKYAAGTLSPDETTKFNTMLAQYNNSKPVWDDQTKSMKMSPGNPLSNELMSAIEMRFANKTGPLPNIAYVRELNARENEGETEKETPDAVFSRIMQDVEDPMAAFGSDAALRDLTNSFVEFASLGYFGAPFKATKDAVAGAEFLNTKTVQTFQKAAELRESVAQLNLLKRLTADPAAFFTGDDAAASKIERMIGLIDEASDLINKSLSEYPLDSKQYTEAMKNLDQFAQLRAGYSVFDQAYKMRGGTREDLEQQMRELLGLKPKQ